ncbi:MAG: hypothetical protein WKF36_08015 [Candidatus Nitrosocosmicus sp.]
MGNYIIAEAETAANAIIAYLKREKILIVFFSCLLEEASINSI